MKFRQLILQTIRVASVAALVLGYVYPYGIGPLNTIPAEAFAAIGWILLGGCYFSNSRAVAIPPRLCMLLFLLPALLSLYALGDLIAGRNEYGARVALYLLHMGAVAATSWFGLQVGISHKNTAAKACLQAVAIALVAASLLNGLSAFAQYFELRLPEWLFVKLVGTRPFGNVRQPNLYALLLALGLIALAGIANNAQRTRKVSTYLLVATAIFIGVASSLSGSRTGLLFAFIIGIGVWLGHPLSRSARWVATAGAAATILGWGLFSKFSGTGTLPYSGLQRLDISTGGDFTSRRSELWAAMIQLIEKHPIIGTGYSRLNYDYFLLDVPAPLGFNLQNAHNLPLHLAVEHGVPLAVLWLVVLGALLWAVRKTWNQPIPRMLWLGLAAVGVHSCLELPLWYLYFLLPTSFALGTLTGFSIATKQEPDMTQTTPVKPGMVATTAIAGLLVVAGVWRDYNKILPIFMGSNQEAMARLEEGYKTVFFTSWMDYAVVANTPVTPENAKLHYRISKRVSTFVIQNFIVMNLALSSSMLGHPEEAAFYLKRLKGVYGDGFEPALAKLTPDELEVLKPALKILYTEKQ